MIWASAGADAVSSLCAARVLTQRPDKLRTDAVHSRQRIAGERCRKKKSGFLPIPIQFSESRAMSAMAGLLLCATVGSRVAAPGPAGVPGCFVDSRASRQLAHQVCLVDGGCAQLSRFWCSEQCASLGFALAGVSPRGAGPAPPPPCHPAVAQRGGSVSGRAGHFVGSSWICVSDSLRLVPLFIDLVKVSAMRRSRGAAACTRREFVAEPRAPTVRCLTFAPLPWSLRWKRPTSAAVGTNSGHRPPSHRGASATRRARGTQARPAEDRSDSGSSHPEASRPLLPRLPHPPSPSQTPATSPEAG